MNSETKSVAPELKVEVFDQSGDATATMPELLKNRIADVTKAIAETIHQVQREIYVEPESGDVVKKGAVKLKEVEIKFGVFLEAEAGVVIGKSRGGATFEVVVSFDK